MIIAQISDIHLGREPGGGPDSGREANMARLERVMAALLQVRPRPEVVLATGDLTDFGAPEAFRALRRAWEGWEVWPLLGNHDARAGFAEVFPEWELAGGFLQWERLAGGLRVIGLDTLEEGRTAGAWCEARAAWLAERLEGEGPVLLALHHPPVPSGLDWHTERADAEWVLRLEALVRGSGRVVAVVGGHYHLPMVSAWAGTVVVAAPSVAPALVADFGEVDVERPDGRALVRDEPPGFVLHVWDAGRLLSHFVRVEEAAVVSRFDERAVGMMRGLFGEREGGV